MKIVDYLLPYLQTIVYIIVFSTVIIAAQLLYRIGQAQVPKRKKKRLRDSLLESKEILENNFYDAKADQLFHDAGNPLGLNLIRYQVLRYSIIVVGLLITHINWLASSEPYSIKTIGWYIVLFLLTNPTHFPMKNLLMRLKEHHVRLKNKELFMLYSMLRTRFINTTSRQKKITALLEEVKPYFYYLKPALNILLLNWNRDPKTACELFAQEVGTKESEQLATIIYNLDKSSPKDSIDIITSQYNLFRTIRLQNHRYRLKVRGDIGYLVTFTPIFVILFNFLYLYYLELSDLMDFMNM